MGLIKTKTKSAPVFQLKELDETGLIKGYGSVFGNKDSYGDVVVKGAFLGSLAERGMPKMLWQHDRRQPIGSWTKAEEDDVGLYLEGRLNMDVQQGRESYALLKAQDIDGLSIGYRLKRWEYDEDEDIFYLKEIELLEVSVVSIPANDESLVGDVKSLMEQQELIDKLKAGNVLSAREFEKMLKGSLGFSNAEAERAARIQLKGRGDPDETASSKFLKGLLDI